MDNTEGVVKFILKDVEFMRVVVLKIGFEGIKVIEMKVKFLLGRFKVGIISVTLVVEN